MAPELLSLLAGLSHGLSMPGYNLEFLAWISPALLMKALDETPPLRAGFVSAIYSITFLSISHYWLASTLMRNFSKFLNYPPYLGFLTFLIFLLYESIFYFAFGLLYSLFKRWMKSAVHSLLFAPALYTFLEYLRSLGDLGFTGGLLTDAFYRNHTVLFLVSFLGSYGVLYIVVMTGSILKELSLKNAVVALSALYLVFFQFQTTVPKISSKDFFNVTVYQTADNPISRYNLPYHGNLRRALARRKDDTVLITPEAFAAPYPVKKEDLFFLPKNILFGISFKEGKRYYNAAAYKTPSGKIEVYKKVRLFPFAEKLPYPKVFSFLGFLKKMVYYSPGEGYHPLKIEGKRVGVLICFESYFEDGALTYQREGADFLVIMTNDGWFRSDLALWQHFSKAIFRAAETGMWVVQVANGGITGVVDSRGWIRKTLPPNKEITVTFEVGKKKSALYGRWSKFLPIILLSLLGISMAFVEKKQKIRVFSR